MAVSPKPELQRQQAAVSFLQSVSPVQQRQRQEAGEGSQLQFFLSEQTLQKAATAAAGLAVAAAAVSSSFL